MSTTSISVSASSTTSAPAITSLVPSTTDTVITTTASSTPPHLSPSPTCDIDRIRGSIDRGLIAGGDGPIYSWNWPDRAVNFTRCCAENQPVYYIDWCTMYCVANENGTLTALGNCLENVLGERYMGIYGVSNGASSMKVDKPNVVLALAMMALVSSGLWLN